MNDPLREKKGLYMVTLGDIHACSDGMVKRPADLLFNELTRCGFRSEEYLEWTLGELLVELNPPKHTRQSGLESSLAALKYHTGVVIEAVIEYRRKK